METSEKVTRVGNFFLLRERALFLLRELFFIFPFLFFRFWFFFLSLHSVARRCRDGPFFFLFSGAINGTGATSW